jgi:hypothetical protein
MNYELGGVAHEVADIIYNWTNFIWGVLLTCECISDGHLWSH